MHLLDSRVRIRPTQFRILGISITHFPGHINETQSIHLSVEGDSYRLVEPLKSDELEKWYKTEEIEDENEEELVVEGDDEDDADLYEIGKFF